MRWKDLTDPSTGAWEGFEFEQPSNARPGLRFEAASWAQLRLVSQSQSVAWWAIDNWAEQQAWLLAPTWPGPVLESPRAADSRKLKTPKDWARFFAKALLASERAPIYRGSWRIEVPGQRRPRWDAPGPPAATRWAGVTRELGVHSAEPLPHNAIIALRRPSAPDDDRVKVWRKAARAGTLPPVLLWWIPGLLNALLVIDGHDRLRAAELEKVKPTFLALWHVEHVAMPSHPQNLEALMHGLWRSRTPIRGVNDMLIDAFRGEVQRAMMRGWKFPGGYRAWNREVRADCKKLGLDYATINME